MTAALAIDFVSDIACPWCAVGFSALERALQRIGPDVAVTLALRPFELNPDMPEGGENVVRYVGRRYSQSPAQSEHNRAVLRERAAEEGFALNMTADSRMFNTLGAHQLLHWVRDTDAALPLKRALFRANFTDNRDIGSPAVLIDVAESIGLDAREAGAILGTDRFAGVVRAEEALWRDRGISSVPATVVNGSHLISGGQPAAAFEEALRRVTQVATH